MIDIERDPGESPSPILSVRGDWAQFSLKHLLFLLFFSGVAISFGVLHVEREKRITAMMELLDQVPDDEPGQTSTFRSASLAQVVNRIIEMDDSEARETLERYSRLTKWRSNLRTVAHLLVDPSHCDPPTLCRLKVCDGILILNDPRPNMIGSGRNPYCCNEEFFKSDLRDASFRTNPIEIPENPVPVYRVVLKSMIHDDWDGNSQLKRERYFLRQIINEVGLNFSEFESKANSLDDLKELVFALKIRLNPKNYRYELQEHPLSTDQ